MMHLPTGHQEYGQGPSRRVGGGGEISAQGLFLLGGPLHGIHVLFGECVFSKSVMIVWRSSQSVLAPMLISCAYVPKGVCGAVGAGGPQEPADANHDERPQHVAPAQYGAVR
jgi:hypothetical protein